MCSTNKQQRGAELQSAEEIVADGASKFASGWQVQEVRPVINALMSKAEDIRSSQLSRTLKKLPSLTGEERHLIDVMTRSIVTRILRDPVQFLKSTGNDGHFADIARQVFRLKAERRK